MKCPVCDHDETKVVDSRVAADGLSIRRRRECLKCGFRFSTFEETEILDLTVVKKDGQREGYSREKIARGLRRALEKRPIGEVDFRKLINLIEKDIQVLRQTEVPTEAVGEIVLRRLKDVDEVAYIRFASVYRSFVDAAAFKEELNQLIKNIKH